MSASITSAEETIDAAITISAGCVAMGRWDGAEKWAHVAFCLTELVDAAYQRGRFAPPGPRGQVDAP